jgi:hypothetical protein
MSGASFSPELSPEEKAIQAAYLEACRAGLEESLEKAEQQTEAHPDDPEAWILLGVVSSPRVGVNAMKRAVQLDPDNRWARAGLRWSIKRLQEHPVRTPSPVTDPAQRLLPLAREKSHPQIQSRHVLAITAVAAMVGAALLVSLWSIPETRKPIQNSISTVIRYIAPTFAPSATPEPSLTPASVMGLNSTPTFPSPLDLLPPSAAGANGKLIIVSLSRQRVFAYRGNVIVYSFVASTGRNGSTAPGQYQILEKMENAFSDLWGFEMPYWMGLYYPSPDNENGFHGLPVLNNGGTLWGDELGSPVSYGCVVMSTDDARLLYQWAELGMPVYINY